ncbi:MAG: SDR family oxidoreductase [Gammaproteobacteria bacterium]|nr:SDR family oxidoreductase [Gammaproteobacteria bacterium]
MNTNSESIVARRLAGALAVLSAVVAMQFAAADEHAAQESVAAADSAKTVLITGSNRGIGLAFARHYAGASDANWRVIATCRRPGQAEALKALAAERGNIEIVMLDVTREDHILSLVERYAGQPIDLLINNAAILGPPPDQSLGGLDYGQFEQTMAVNVYAPLRVSEALADNVAAAGGKIVALTSGLGSMQLMGRMRGLYFYRMSKSALNMGWRALRSDLQPRGVTVLLVAPGQVDTRMLRASGFRGEAMTTDDSAAGMAKIIADATIEDPGLPINVDGWIIPW